MMTNEYSGEFEVNQELICGNEENALNDLTQAYDLGERSPQVLQPLAQLAYQAEDLTLTRQVCTILVAERLSTRYGGLDLFRHFRNWLDGDLWVRAKKQLEKAFGKS